jgi:hypothetical protein
MRRRGAWVPCLLAGLALIGLAVSLQFTRQSPAHGQAVPLVNVGTVPATVSTSSTSASTHAPADDPGVPPPPGSHLLLDRLAVDAPITDVAVHAGVMDVPLNPRTVGWWSGGAAPGADHGSVVIVGHINYAGTAGALGVLPRARPGDVVELHDGGRTVRYRMVAVHSYPKTSGIPADAFSTTGPARLVLITCGGPFDPNTGNYLDNIVGYAQPL